MKYKALLEKKAKGTPNVDLIVKEAELSIQSESLTVEKELCSLQQDLDSLKSSDHLDADSIYTTSNKIKLLDRKLEFYCELRKELF